MPPHGELKTSDFWADGRLMPAHGEIKTSDFWVGSLAMTIAVASTDPEPQRILRSALREFLADRPPGNELGDLLRITLGKGKP